MFNWEISRARVQTPDRAMKPALVILFLALLFVASGAHVEKSAHRILKRRFLFLFTVAHAQEEDDEMEQQPTTESPTEESDAVIEPEDAYLEDDAELGPAAGVETSFLFPDSENHRKTRLVSLSLRV